MMQAPELTGVLMSNLFWLTDAQMERLRPFFPKSHGVPRVDAKDSQAKSLVVFRDITLNRTTRRGARGTF